MTRDSAFFPEHVSDTMLSLAILIQPLVEGGLANESSKLDFGVVFSQIETCCLKKTCETQQSQSLCLRKTLALLEK